jgi:CRP-like cAMP-binding protein
MAGVDLFSALPQNPLLQGFSDDGVKIIRSVCVARRLPAGSPIFVERMLGESAFLLLDGEVRVTVHRQGLEHELGTLQAPDVFGELSLLHPGPRRASVHALTNVQLAEIARRDFVALQKDRPQACAKLLSAIAERFGRAAHQAGPILERLVDTVF